MKKIKEIAIKIWSYIKPYMTAKYIVSTICLILFAWGALSYFDILFHNMGPEPNYQVWNIFELFSKYISPIVR